MVSRWWRHCMIVSCSWYCKTIFKIKQLLILTTCDCINIYGCGHTSKHIIYYVNHHISVKNILSRFLRPDPGVL